METLSSRVFPHCTYKKGEEAVFSDLHLLGYAKPVSLYLSAETTGDDRSAKNAAAFFDQVRDWDKLCRKIFLSFHPGSEEYALLEGYFKFFREEFPKDLGDASRADLVKRLRLKGMAAHEQGDNQRFVVDFTLGYFQILCAQFDHAHKFTGLSWDN